MSEVDKIDLADQNMQALKENPYSGRGFVLGQSRDGDKDVIIYWLTGRSVSSRNRKFSFDEADGSARTEAYDPSLLEHPELLIYPAIKETRAYLATCQVVSNGDQTNTIVDGFIRKSSFEESLDTRTYEPDEPNYTARISGLLIPSEGDRYPHIKISKIWRPIAIDQDWLKGKDTRPALHDVWRPKEKAGFGSMIHTYESDGNPLPVFEGGPRVVLLDEAIEDIAESYWNLLSQPNRVALVVKAIQRSTSRVEWASFAQYNGYVKKQYSFPLAV